jgi:hypothetical protein
MTPLIDIAATLENPRTWLGYQRMMDAITKGDDLSDVLLNLDRFQANQDAPNYDLFNGALLCLLDSWSSLVVSGATATNENKTIQSFLNGSKARMLCDLVHEDVSNTNALGLLIFWLCFCVNAARKYIRFAVQKPAPFAEKALAVRIVSEPERITTQTVQRDANMEIVSTTTRTMDA